eukprot:15587863-Heterocapsa_arctica.AAC.2
MVINNFTTNESRHTWLFKKVQTNHNFFNGAQVIQRAINKAKQVQATTRTKHEADNNIITETESEDKALDFVVDDRRKQYQGYGYQKENRDGDTIGPKHNQHRHDQVTEDNTNLEYYNDTLQKSNKTTKISDLQLEDTHKYSFLVALTKRKAAANVSQIRPIGLLQAVLQTL